LFNGKLWKQNTILTATLYPGIMGIIFLAINSFVAFYGSSTAVRLHSQCVLLFCVLFLYFS